VNRPDQKIKDILTDNPLLLENEDSYQSWRAQKLADYPKTAQELVVRIHDPQSLSVKEARALTRVLRKTNMAIYQGPACRANKAIPRALATQFGLQRLDPNMLADDDGITSLHVVDSKQQRGYIPYSNKRLLWHTDGYYNLPSHWIRAFILHCVEPAHTGGENALLDHELVYLSMRDSHPEYIAALMHPQAMTIPTNTETHERERPAQAGPVFSIDPDTGCLHMRYTARRRSIIWRDDEVTRKAVAWLEDFMQGENPYIFRHGLSSGQGILCNNVLHSRTAFEDRPGLDQQRLLYRGRYYDRIAGTELDTIQEVIEIC